MNEANKAVNRRGGRRVFCAWFLAAAELPWSLAGRTASTICLSRLSGVSIVSLCHYSCPFESLLKNAGSTILLCSN